MHVAHRAAAAQLQATASHRTHHAAAAMRARARGRRLVLVPLLLLACLACHRSRVGFVAMRLVATGQGALGSGRRGGRMGRARALRPRTRNGMGVESACVGPRRKNSATRS